VKNIIDKLLEKIDYYCWNVSGDTVCECYSAHCNRDLYEMANIYLEYPDIYIIETISDEIYKRYNEVFQKKVEKLFNSVCSDLNEEAEKYDE